MLSILELPLTVRQFVKVELVVTVTRDGSLHEERLPISASIVNGEISISGAVQRRVASASYAASVTPNAGNTDVLLIGALTGAIQIENPSGVAMNRQSLQIEVTQDATGGRSLTFGSKFHIPSSSELTSPVFSPAFLEAGKRTKIMAQYNATTDKWEIVSFIPGY